MLLDTWVPEVRARCNVESLRLTEAAATMVETLSWHDRDPFDRMLIAVDIAWAGRGHARRGLREAPGADLLVSLSPAFD